MFTIALRQLITITSLAVCPVLFRQTLFRLRTEGDDSVGYNIVAHF